MFYLCICRFGRFVAVSCKIAAHLSQNDRHTGARRPILYIMSVVLTYTSALEALRLPEYPDLASSWDERSGYLSERLPTVDELERALADCPPLQRLSRPIHLLVSSDNTSHSSRLITRHVTRRTHPRDAFVRISGDVYVASPELIPLQMTRIATDLDEALLMSELCGAYAVAEGEESGMLQRREPLTTRGRIEAFLPRMRDCYGMGKVRSALPLVCADSGSPYESKLAIRLRADREIGGYGLKIVSMNEEISLEAIGRAFEERRIRKPDILILAPPSIEPDPRMPFRGVAVDYKGKVHDERPVAERDDTRRNELLAHGFKPYELRKAHYDDIDYMDDIVTKIRRDLRLPSDDLAFGRAQRVALHDALELVDGVRWGRATIPDPSDYR